MGSDFGIYLLVFVLAAIVISRVDRLGKQLEAVGVSIRADLARTDDDRTEILAEWKQAKEDEAKDRRQFWIFWSLVAVAALFAWAFINHRGLWTS